MPITTEEPTPCFGRSDLFDSLDLEHHREAAQLCMTCPTLAACKRLLEDVQRTSAVGGQPEGTWAGRLVGAGRRTVKQIAAEDAKYTDEEARIAYGHHRQGIRTDWVIGGYRAHARRAKLARKEAA